MVFNYHSLLNYFTCPKKNIFQTFIHKHNPAVILIISCSSAASLLRTNIRQPSTPGTEKSIHCFQLQISSTGTVLGSDILLFLVRRDLSLCSDCVWISKFLLKSELVMGQPNSVPDLLTEMFCVVLLLFVELKLVYIPSIDFLVQEYRTVHFLPKLLKCSTEMGRLHLVPFLSDSWWWRKSI